MKTHQYFRWLITGLALLLVGVNVFTKGMFADGQQYATIALNYVRGTGSFWYPMIYDTWNDSINHSFLEQPQLGYWIESWWFRLLGDAYYVEKIFCFCMLIFNAILLEKIWRKIFDKQQQLQSFSWLPIGIWLLMPTTIWAFQHNVLEIIMGLFCSAAVYCSLQVIGHQKYKWIYFGVSIILIFLSVFTKGLPGLYPLAFFGLHYIVLHKKEMPKHLMFVALQIIGLLLIVFFIYHYNKDAQITWNHYWFDRLWARVNNASTVSNRFKVMVDVFNESILSLVLIAIAAFVFRKQTLAHHLKLGLFFILLGLSGALPLALTKVQRGFYFAHALPMFGIGFSIFLLPFAQKLIHKINTSVTYTAVLKYVTLAIIMVGAALTIYNTNGFVRDKNIITDIQKMQPLLGNCTSIGAAGNLEDRWDVRFYAMRYLQANVHVGETENFNIVYTTDSLRNVLFRGKEISLVGK
jgi:hypothetical protein